MNLGDPSVEEETTISDVDDSIEFPLRDSRVCFCCSARSDKELHEAMSDYCNCKRPICQECYNRIDKCPFGGVSSILFEWSRYVRLIVMQSVLRSDAYND